MKGFRFYLEHETALHKRRGDHTGNCAAVVTEGEGARYVVNDLVNGSRLMSEGAAGVFSEPNSPVAWTAFNHAILRSHYKRISETKAREIHPALFEYLEQPEPPLPLICSSCDKPLPDDDNEGYACEVCGTKRQHLECALKCCDEIKQSAEEEANNGPEPESLSTSELVEGFEAIREGRAT